MDQLQKTALEGLIARALTPEEILAIDPLLPVRNDVAIAELLSVGRTRLKSRDVGVGTIIEVMGATGGEFLDTLVSLGASNRNVHWAMVLIQNSKLDIGKQATQDQMTQLAAALPPFASGLEALKSLGKEPDPISYNTVSNALNIAEGRATL